MGVRYVGAEVRRLEDPRLITGRGRYVDDIKLPGMLHAAFVRSSHAHALIRSIDVGAARDMPGVHAVYTLADLGAPVSERRMPQPFPAPAIKQSTVQYPLARDEVCYVGEPIAVIIADSRHLAEDAIAMVDIDYEPLPAVVDCREALKDGAETTHRGAPDNLAARLSVGFGDVDGAFRNAPHVFDLSLTQHRGGGHSMECRGVVASHDIGTDKLTIWTSTQTPYLVRRFLARTLDVDEQSLRIIAPDVGGGFGPKAVFYPEEVVIPIAAKKLGVPVKWVEDRRENFVTTTNQRDQHWRLEVACDDTGKMLGIRGHAINDNGAYLPYGLLLPASSLAPFPGAYALPALAITMDVVFTNTTPTTPVRGAGRPNAIFAIERTVDVVAKRLGLDPAEVRRRNFVQKDQFPYVTGMLARDGSPVAYDSGDYVACLDRALVLADREGFRARQEEARARGRYLGMGMSSFIEDTGLGPFEGVTVRVTPGGAVQILTGAASQGQGHATTFAQICAEALGVDISRISVIAADTDRFPFGTGTVASRIAVTGGSSTHEAALKVRAKALTFAADKLEVAEEDLVIEDGVVHVQGVPDMKLELGDIALALSGTVGQRVPAGLTPGLEETAYFESKATPHASGSNVTEVEVDIETGAVRILNYVVVHDCGRVINPKIVDGQIIGGVVHGIGNALFEEMLYDDQGQPISTNYGEYLLPIATEMPPIILEHIETLSPLNPLGVKGVGESGTIPAAAAIIAAVEDALSPFGIRVDRYPLSPERIVTMVDGARAAPAAF
jgi:aerobic carbon-monoxide dehydrogenase large subunit